MALYHDIGKIDNPQFYTENHSIYENPHLHLSPRESAKAIISHITTGMERADQLKLPDMIGEAIQQHHGTKRVKFFYEKAKSAANGDLQEFNEAMFRYPGRKPQDIEKRSSCLPIRWRPHPRASVAPQDEDIRNVIEQIVADDIAENQFDECEGLTFKALKRIAASFYDKLASIYHQRVSYPGFDFKANGSHDLHPD